MRAIFTSLTALAALLLAARATAQNCDDCTHGLPCPGLPGSNFATQCPGAFNVAVQGLLDLGLIKGNLTLIQAAACLADMAMNNKFAFCDGLGTAFMQTQADCVDRSVTPPRLIWCPIDPRNCVCINPTFFNGCDLTLATGDPVAQVAILAAALAHEVCHAKSAGFSSTDGGVTFTPPCAFILNELACVCLELDILNCVLSVFPTNTPLNNRAFFLTDIKAHWEQEKVNNGC